MTSPFGTQLDAVRSRASAVSEALAGSGADSVDRAHAALDELMATLDELSARSAELVARHDVLDRQRSYYATLFNSLPAASLVTDRTARILDVNDRAATLLGSSPRSLVDRPLSEFVADADQVALSRVVERAPRAAEETTRTDLRLRGRGRHTVPLHVVAVVSAASSGDGQPELRWFFDEGVNSLAYEEMTPAEREASTAMATLAAIIESAADGIITVDSDQEIIVFNRAAEEMFGYRSAEVLGRPLSMLIPPSARGPHEHLVAEFASGGDTSRRMAGRTIEAQRRDRSRFSVAITVSRTHVDGHPVSTAIVRDVTEAIRARRELQFATEFNQRIIATLDALVVVFDASGKVLVFNEACERTTGFRLADLTDARAAEELLVPPDERLRSRRALSPLLTGAVDRAGLECGLQTRDGAVRRIRWSNTVLTDEDGTVTHVIGTGIDITHERELETQLETSQRLELLGQLAAGVAHDLNNMLSVTQGQLEFISETDDLPSSVLPRLDAMASALRRTKALVGNLSTTGRRTEAVQVDIHAHEVITSLVRLMEDALGDGIELRLDLSAPDDTVRIDPTQFEQVLLNLVVNARDAVGGSGHVAVASRTARGPEGPDGFLLTVADDGPGMDAATLDRAFEPFFTTKPAGGGLGLATSAMVVEGVGGAMTAKSDGSSGTTMSVWLPQAVGRRGSAGGAGNGAR